MLECSCEILMPSSFPTRRPHVLATLAFLAIFVQALSISTRAEVHVAGGSDAITVEAKEASVEELLTALKKILWAAIWVLPKTEPVRLGNFCRIASAGGLACAFAPGL